MWGSGDIIPLVPSLAIRYRPIVRITPLSFLTQVQYRNYPSFRRLCGSRSRSGFFWKQTNPLLLPVIEPRFLGCLAHSLVIIATTLSRRSSFAVVINLFGVKCFFIIKTTMLPTIKEVYINPHYEVNWSWMCIILDGWQKKIGIFGKPGPRIEYGWASLVTKESVTSLSKIHSLILCVKWEYHNSQIRVCEVT